MKIILKIRSIVPPAITLLAALLFCGSPASAADLSDALYDAEDLTVKISADRAILVVNHGGEEITILRHPDPSNTIATSYAKTSRPCPPFCVQPMSLAPGVQTIGELELLDYLQQASNGDDSVLVIDSRDTASQPTGTIPGSINIPWQQLDPQQSDADDIAEILEFEFGAQREGPFWNFNAAKTLVMFCNGVWCGQSPTNIRLLLSLGYPADKLKWYRGGMQAWETLGLTTVPAVE